jgi:hypothetical protein
VLLLAAACGERPMADDAALHHDLQTGASGAEVTFTSVVAAEPQQAGTHEHLEVRTPEGDRLEIDHNTDLAQWVPAHQGDQVIVHGQLYIDGPGQQGVHCTHSRTSSGCPAPGWIELHGDYYE